MKIIKGLVYTDKQYIEILQQRIYKAIEYIKYQEGFELDDVKLMKILKGEENDKN